MHTGELLEVWRRRSGKRQKAVAREIGLDPAVLSRIEHGRQRPPRSTVFLEKISTALNLSLDECNALKKKLEIEQQLGDFVSGTNSEQFNLAVTFADCLKELNPPQIAAIQAILALTGHDNPSSAQSTRSWLFNPIPYAISRLQWSM